MRILKLLPVVIGALLLAGCGCEHEYNHGEITIEPACTSVGEKTFTCNKCHQKYTEEIPKTEHDYDKGKVVVKSTCTEEGKKEYTCKICGFVKSESINKLQHRYSSEITQKSTFEREGIMTYTCDKCGDSYTESIPVRDDEVDVVVTNKTSLDVDYNENRYSKRVEFEFTIENMTDKAIKGVQGKLFINDLFDENILSFNCDFTGREIPVGEKINISNLGIDINIFMSEHLKLYNEEFENLSFDYKIDNVVYSDGTLKDISYNSDVSTETQDVSVKVKDKKSLDINYNAGRYVPRVEFVFDVTNNIDKKIKGVQGNLIIKDMFGENIMTINCDFTGKTIASGKTETFSDLGIDINQFMGDHVKLYNEKYEDLQFVYEISNVVYAE